MLCNLAFYVRYNNIDRKQQSTCIQHRPVVVSSCVVVITASTATANKRIYVEIYRDTQLAARWVVEM